MDIASELRRLRRERKWNQQQLGDVVGVSQSQVGRWETGERPAVKHAPKLAELLGVSEMELLAGLYAEQAKHSTEERIANLEEGIDDLKTQLGEVLDLVRRLAAD